MSMVKNKFKKDYGNRSCTGYSKEYMDAYMSWYKKLSRKQKKRIENCNTYTKGKTEKERARNKRQTRNYYSKCKNPML